jgi:hypothetical protein
VNLAIELGVPKDRIDTIIDFAAAQQYGVKTEGSQEARNSRILAELAGLVAEGKLDVPLGASRPVEISAGLVVPQWASVCLASSDQ